MELGNVRTLRGIPSASDVRAHTEEELADAPCPPHAAVAKSQVLDRYGSQEHKNNSTPGFRRVQLDSQSSISMVYQKLSPEELILRDHLARDRTVLANERTLLSYVRTAFGFLAGGVTLIKLFPRDAGSFTLGIVLVVLAALVAIIGAYRFVRVAARMNAILRRPENGSGNE